MDDFNFPMYGESWWNVLSAFSALPAQFAARIAGGGPRLSGDGLEAAAISIV